MIDCMYKIGEIARDVWYTGTCALESPRGTNYDYMSNQEKIYIDIKDFVQLYWREQRGGNIVWLSWDVLYSVI